ncbi:prepilin-type N-terminal cleavage/methylation domain-containing protein [Novosphingobium sp.]|uniref:prepilin-type N-terminal cleavage/methylation domain-containing protein n=1 Tax=Novosphingobium sp. TaxID=1874826 RepID=UPI00263181E2|nr:prepilin-type N-terminal cleavage/methylation domain-containing protein [Novosphingobium sp.]
MNRPQSAAGFTLVEMLVCLAILGMVSAVLVTGIGRMDLRQRMIGQKDAQIDEIAQAQFTLRHLIANIHPSISPQTGNTVEFVGNQFGLEFDGKPPGNASPDALQRYRLRLERGGDLMLYRISTLDETVDRRQPDVTGWTATRLLSGVSSLSVRYLGSPDGRFAGAGLPPQWQLQWSSRDVLPSLVSLRIEFPPGDRRAWPDLVVRLRVANGDTCARDLRTDECRVIP